MISPCWQANASIRPIAFAMNGLAELWADLLSADTRRIERAWRGLRAHERQAVLDHLARMRDGDGWHASQREAAAAALRVIHAAA